MKELLSIAPPTPAFPPAVLESEGGFVWWYVDLIDADGNGLVLIWSFGLPFLPGYAAAARSGLPQRPAERPSINVAVFRRGKLACYLLQELEPHEASWNESTWKFGDSTLEARLEDGRWLLDAQLDCPLPAGARLFGDVRVDGVARRSDATDAWRLGHDWAPLVGPAHGSARLLAGDEVYELEGRAYFDGNVGLQPLQHTAIAAWTWGRLPQPDREQIYYILWDDLDDLPQATGVEIDQHGVLDQFPLRVQVVAQRRGLGGLRYPAELTLYRGDTVWARARATDVLDDGPFYLRFVVDSGGVLGIGEYCRTDRIDLARHRPLVRMRVQRSDGDNSMWLPLFVGPRGGRVKRLLRQLVER